MTVKDLKRKLELLLEDYDNFDVLIDDMHESSSLLTLEKVYVGGNSTFPCAAFSLNTRPTLVSDKGKWPGSARAVTGPLFKTTCLRLVT